jgi:hypothetical protein
MGPRALLLHTLVGAFEKTSEGLTDEQIIWALGKLVDMVCIHKKLDREKVKAEIDRWASLDG